MTSLSLSIRPVRMRDLPGLGTVSSVLSLNQPDASLLSYSPMRSAIGCMMPGRHRGRFFVAQADEGVLAFAHFVPEPPDQRWKLAALGASTGVYDVTPLWEELLERSTVAAGLRGVKRLFAGAPSGSPVQSALSATGFQSFATESLFHCDSCPVPQERLRLRRQEANDTWAIHQLYNAVVPRQVQYAEAFTSHRWDTQAGNQSGAVINTMAWLVEEAFQVVAYARVSSFGAAHVLEIMVHPEWVSISGDLLDSVIAKIAARSRIGRISVASRGYQQELSTALFQRGFRQYGELTQSVKYTTARVVAPSVDATVPQESVLERLPKPKRAPSFLWNRRDENA